MAGEAGPCCSRPEERRRGTAVQEAGHRGVGREVELRRGCAEGRRTAIGRAGLRMETVREEGHKVIAGPEELRTEIVVQEERRTETGQVAGHRRAIGWAAVGLRKEIGLEEEDRRMAIEREEDQREEERLLPEEHRCYRSKSRIHLLYRSGCCPGAWACRRRR